MPNSLNRLFRRLRESHDEAKKHKKSSNFFHTFTSDQRAAEQKINNCRSGEPMLPEALLFRILEDVESPFELFSLRRANKNCADYVRSRIGRVSEMDLRRVSFDELSSSSVSSSGTSAQSETTVILQGELWHVHPSGCKVLCRMSPVDEQQHISGDSNNGDNKSAADTSGTFDGLQVADANIQLRLEVLVDEQWTSREIAILCSLVNEFRQAVKRISVDAPIFELIVANLAAVDLDRWFAYQCFVKAVDDGQMSATLNKLAAQLQQQQQNDPLDAMVNDNELYWPNAKTILVRTTERESVHLARVLFYGVRANLLMDRRRLDRLALLVCVADAAIVHVSMSERPKELVRNLYHFRCWAGSPGFDERFSQQWRCAA
uniref:F-box domain-containing protein n=1 Tax=Globodera pallida TaxID=36090 RepID=A0A183BV72_GLOPA